MNVLNEHLTQFKTPYHKWKTHKIVFTAKIICSFSALMILLNHSVANSTNRNTAAGTMDLIFALHMFSVRLLLKRARAWFHSLKTN